MHINIKHDGDWLLKRDKLIYIIKKENALSDETHEYTNYWLCLHANDTILKVVLYYYYRPCLE